MARIFISYRREDSDIWVSRLVDELRKHFPPEQVFQDIASIDPGADFVEALEKGLSTAAVMLAVIGQRWLSATDKQGRRRLDMPGDFVRQEIAESLRRPGVSVFPLLVNGAEMPAEEELPEPLKALHRRQAFELTVRHWHQDVAQLVQTLKRAPGFSDDRRADEDFTRLGGRAGGPAPRSGGACGDMNDKTSFWTTLPGILTGIAGVIGTIGGLILVLNQTTKNGTQGPIPQTPLDERKTVHNSDYPDTKAVRTYDNFDSSTNDGAFDKSKWKLSDDQTGSMGYISQKDGRLTLARKELTDPKAEGGFGLVAREYDEIKVQDEMFFEATLMVDKRQDGHISIALSSTAPTEPYSDCILGYGEDKAEMVCYYYGNGNDDDEAECESQTLSAKYGIWHTIGIVIKPATMEFVYYADTENIGSCKPRSKEVFKKGEFTFQIAIWGDSSKPVLGYIDEVKVGL